MRAKWLCVLLGNDRTGKTTFQKNVVKLLSGENKDYRLDCNLRFTIVHPHIIRKMRTFSIGNRSYQEKGYQSVSDYFLNHFQDTDLAFVSSHVTDPNGATYDAEIREIINEGHYKFYNVCGLFFTNSIAKNKQANRDISELHWDERWVIDNPLVAEPKQQEAQLRLAAEELVQMLIQRTRGW